MASAIPDMNEVIHEETLYKLCGKTKHLWNKAGAWKQKHFVLKIIGDKPVLEYYSKKPKNKHVQPKGRIHLFPSYRVEKVTNTRNRAYVFEVTTPECYLCVSADEQKTMDVFVFYLQIQTQLHDRIKEDCVIVKPENSEAQRRIGARSTECILNLSPWGVTLALACNRAVLSQWPLKSIRCYESTGTGHFTLEAGRVAPMGDGLYVFTTDPGQDNAIYDTLDQYVIDAMGKVQPSRRGTAEEMDDYILELEQLFGLAQINVCTSSQPEIPQILHDNWNHIPSIPARPRPITHSKKSQLNTSQSSQDNKATPPPLPDRQTDSPRLGSTRRDVNTGWSAVNSSFHLEPLSSTSSLVNRPPLPLPGETKTKTPTPTPPLSIPSSKRSQTKKFVKSVSQTSTRSTDSHLSQLSPFTPLAKDWISPPSFQEATAANSESSPPSSPNLSPDPYLHPSTKRHHADAQTQDDSMQSYLSPMTREEQAELKRPKSENRMSRLRSVSCEDLSDYVKDMIYMPMEDSFESKSLDELNDSQTDSSRPPLPFPHIKSYVGSIDMEQRERSHSIDYYNVNLRGAIDRSPSPTVTELRRRYNSRVRSNLRKSVSNPNFIHALKKEMRDSNKAAKSLSGTSPLKSKSKSRSLVSLLPENLKRRLSKDGSKRDSGESQTQRGSRSGSLPSSPPLAVQRQTSSQSGINIKIKGITVSEASRSFKKQISPEKITKQFSSDTSATNNVAIENRSRGKLEMRSPIFKKRDSPSPKLRRQNAELSSTQTHQKPDNLDKPHNNKKKPVVASKPHKDKTKGQSDRPVASNKSNPAKEGDRLMNGDVETNC
ncbi:hypothetical protein ScPMuIL_010590 [Solemya velum]